MKKFLAILLLFSFLCVSCTSKNEKPAAENPVTSTVNEPPDKYEEYERLSVEYEKPMEEIDKEQVFFMDLKVNPEEMGIEDLRDIADVYADADFSVSIEPELVYDEEQKQLSIAPPYFGAMGIPGLLYFNDWGNAGKYYLVRYYDADGNKLEKPAVTIFTVRRELETPVVEYYIQDGFLGLRWEPVEGATKYQIVKVYKYKEDDAEASLTYDVSYLSETEETDYIYENILGDGKTFMLLNRDLRINEDDGYSEYDIAVAAVNDEDESSVLSNYIQSKDIASVLPYSISYAGEGEDTDTYVRDVNVLGLFRKVEMCDRSIVTMPVTYDFSRGETISLWDYADKNSFTEEEYNKYKDLYVYKIPYRINKTAFELYSIVIDADYPDFQDDLNALKERQEAVQSRGGSLQTSTLLASVERQGSGNTQNKPGSLDAGKYRIFASNALSEYLAVQMINGNDAIDLNGYNEAYDTDYLVDAWMEAVYQNPYILGASKISLNKKTNELYVEYELDRAAQKDKQEEVAREVKRVVADVIKSGMSDLEKEIALNNYLCETSVYDTDALENAEKNDFKFVDPEFNDSFTAYGILINKKGVCASYAASFNLLAQEAGLKSIVATGYLSGSLPHAWNRVLIDGEWKSIDVTNNDNPELFNVLFNLNDDVAGTVLVEDRRYMLDKNIGVYKARTLDAEYYQVEGKFFSQTDIVDKLIQELAENGYATLRTDYDLDDDKFYSIAEAVIEKGNVQKLSGYHWIGTIYLKSSGAIDTSKVSEGNYEPKEPKPQTEQNKQPETPAPTPDSSKNTTPAPSEGVVFGMNMDIRKLVAGNSKIEVNKFYLDRLNENGTMKLEAKTIGRETAYNWNISFTAVGDYSNNDNKLLSDFAKELRDLLKSQGYVFSEGSTPNCTNWTKGDHQFQVADHSENFAGSVDLHFYTGWYMEKAPATTPSSNSNTNSASSGGAIFGIDMDVRKLVAGNSKIEIDEYYLDTLNENGTMKLKSQTIGGDTAHSWDISFTVVGDYSVNDAKVLSDFAKELRELLKSQGYVFSEGSTPNHTNWTKDGHQFQVADLSENGAGSVDLSFYTGWYME